MDASPDLLGENYQITDGLSMYALLDLSHISGEVNNLKAFLFGRRYGRGRRCGLLSEDVAAVAI